MSDATPRVKDPQGNTMPLCEVVGVFTDPDDLMAAVEELESTAFPRHEISMIAHEKAIGDMEQFGEDVEELLEDGTVQPNPPVRNEERAEARGFLIGSGLYIGAIAAALAAGAVSVPGMIAAAVVGGAGGAGAATVLTKVMGDSYDEKLAQSVDGGGLLLWVRVDDDKQERMAISTMERHNAEFVRPVCMPESAEA